MIPKQITRWWVSYTLQRRKKIVFTYHYELTFTKKTKKKTKFLDWIYQKFYPIFGKLGGETSTESLEICHLKLLLFFLQSTIQKTINWWSIFFGDAAKKPKQIYKTFIKQRYKLGWFINRSKYNINPCKLIIYRFWITIIDVMAAGACCGLVVPNEILTQYLKRKEIHISRHSGLE